MMNSTLLLLKGKISDVNLTKLKDKLDRMESVGYYNIDLSPVLSTLKSPGIRMFFCLKLIPARFSV